LQHLPAWSDAMLNGSKTGRKASHQLYQGPPITAKDHHTGGLSSRNEFPHQLRGPHLGRHILQIQDLRVFSSWLPFAP
jgi:hypothetical protein